MKNTTHVSTENHLKKINSEAFALIETILLENGAFFLLESHLERLNNSARFFSINFNLASIKKELSDLQKRKSKQAFRVRILLKKNGVFSIENTLLTPVKDVMPVALAKHALPIDLFNFHKTSLRDQFDQALKEHPSAFDVLLYNESNELTEFTIGNLVLKLDGCLYTPYTSSGLLPGTFRAHLLESKKIKEARLLVDDLPRAQAVYLINSLRKWVEVKLI